SDSGDIFTRFLVNVALPVVGSIWAAAPQLEVGTRPTSFTEALIDDHPLPEIPWPNKDEYTKVSKDLDLNVRNNQVHRSLVENGNPLFVCGIAFDPEGDFDRGWQYDDIAASGFNTLVLTLDIPENRDFADFTESIRRNIDEAYSRKLRTIPFLTYDKEISFERI